MFGFASIIPFLWPLLSLCLSLEHQIKAVSPVFTMTPYFTFTYQKITSLFVVWTRKIQIPYILFPVMEKWTARHGIAGTPCCLHTCPVSSPWFPRHARSPRQDPFVSTCHVSRVSLPRVCLCDCLSVSAVICWSSSTGLLSTIHTDTKRAQNLASIVVFLCGVAKRHKCVKMHAFVYCVHVYFNVFFVS